MDLLVWFYFLSLALPQTIRLLRPNPMLYSLLGAAWWRRGRVLAYGDCGPGFDSLSQLQFPRHTSLRSWVFYLSVFPG